jgi:hypothetical protein
MSRENVENSSALLRRRADRPASGAFLHTVSQGKIVRTVQYGSREEALEAAGLRQQ